VAGQLQSALASLTRMCRGRAPAILQQWAAERAAETAREGKGEATAGAALPAPPPRGGKTGR